jgi:hypothetical protein
VRLLLNVQIVARLGERAVDAGGDAVDDRQAGAVTHNQASDHLLGEVGRTSIPVPYHDDPHAEF